MKRAFWVLLALFLLTAAGLTAISRRLQVPAAPQGILSFEFCAWTGTCDAALSQWGERGARLMLLSLGLDYLFLLLYPALIGVCLLLVDARPGAATKGAIIGAAIAGLLDAFENFFLIRLALGASGGADAAAWCAAVKFALVGAALARLAALLGRAGSLGARHLKNSN